MTAPFVPQESEPERRARIRENVQRLLTAGIDRARIDRYLESERITPEMEAAREPLGVEDTIRGALANAGEGVGFSLADELMGGLRGVVDPRISMGEGIEQVREERDRFAAAHPKTALGLNIGGAVLPALLTAGGSAEVSVPQMVGRVATSGAGSGAIAGYGSGEGGPLSGERLVRGAVGGVAGGLFGYGLGKLAASRFGESAARGGRTLIEALTEVADTPAPAAAGRAATSSVASAAPVASSGASSAAMRAAGRALGDTKQARTLLDALEAAGMGDEALTMNVGNDRTVRAVRAAANTPASDAGQLVNERLARQGGALGEQVPRDIGDVTGMGGTPGPVRLDDMRRARRLQANDLYARAREEADEYFAGQRAGAAWPERAMNQPKALPGPGQSEVAKAGLPQNSGAVPMGGPVPLRQIPAATGTSQGPTLSLDDAAAMRPVREAPQGPRRVETQAANDVNVRREFDVGAGESAPFSGRDPRDVTRRMRTAADDPIVQRSVADVQRAASTPELMGGTADDFTLLSEAYKDINAQIRAVKSGMPSAQGTRELSGLTAAAAKIDDALSSIAPSWREANAAYRAESEMLGAFDEGMGLPGKPVGTTTVAMRDKVPDVQDALRAGFATNLQQRAGARGSNADLGDLAQFRDVARAVVGTPQDRERFIEAFGRDKYSALLERLMPKIRAAAQNAAARGNSTTTKQLLDALAFGDDAMLDALNALATGNPAQGMMRNLLGRAVSPASRAIRLGIGQTATETADLLTTKGAPQIRTLLDQLEAMGVADAARAGAVAPVAGVAARSTAAGRRPR